MLEAPQLLAKMSLKTNPEMPVHGSDGVHVRYCSETSQLILYWGEAKLYQNLSDAISSAAESIAKALSPSKIKHEISLVRRYISFSGLESDAVKALKAHLNPFKENSNQRVDVTTCLIGFDFSGYEPDPPVGRSQVEKSICDELTKQLPIWASAMSAQLKNNGIGDSRIELFLLPLPSVATFRKMFQQKVGWLPEKEEKSSS
jgi:hypothetical protein